jgi:hypothetical protein
MNPDAIGFVAYYPHGFGQPSIAGYVFGSSQAARAFRVATSFIDSKGVTHTPTIRIERDNVVVYVLRRRTDYKRKIQAALADLT